MNVGVILLLTVTFIVVFTAHWPAVGVKVYIVVPAVEVFIVAGLQVPVMPFVEVVGKVPGVAPKQYVPRAVNEGVILLLTVTIIVVFTAHWPAAGVKVYIIVPAVEVFNVDGLQVPFIPFVEVVGKVPGVAPTQ